MAKRNPSRTPCALLMHRECGVELKAKQPSSNVFYFMKNAFILESFTTTLTGERVIKEKGF
jgi:hypothetical protein